MLELIESFRGVRAVVFLRHKAGDYSRFVGEIGQVQSSYFAIQTDDGQYFVPIENVAAIRDAGSEEH